MILNIFTEIWASLVKFYGMYSDFIHSILPAELGDLLEAVLDIIVACLIVKFIADAAFRTRGGSN